MDTLNDYLNASPVEREAEKTRRGWEAKPPAAHTHRKPGRITSADILASRRRLAARTTPNTRRGEPRPVMDELRLNNTNAGRAHE